jgi:hypothetical protein
VPEEKRSPLTAAHMSHEDLTAYAERLAELRDQAGAGSERAHAFAIALDALHAWSDGAYGQKLSPFRARAVPR